jgi:tRNA pseudouridine13 synthase
MEQKDKSLEFNVGIEVYTTSCKGFSGIIKQRYSDFIVREIDSNSQVAYLKSTDGIELEKKTFAVVKADSADSEAAIDSYMTELHSLGIEFDQEACRVFLYNCINQSESPVADFVAFEGLSKESRTAVHKGIKNYFPNTATSEAVQKDGVTFISLRLKKRGQNAKRTRFEWPQNVGDYLKFLMLKENIDTMNAVNSIAKYLHTKPGNISIAGTKDKRAVTAQWCTVFRRRPSELMGMNKFKYPPVIRLGDFEYVREPLKLGIAKGNRFEIILRDITGSEQNAMEACALVRENGFGKIGKT